MVEEASAKARLRSARFAVMKKGFFIYFLGLFSGMVLFGLFLFLRSIGEGFSHWGDTVVCSDAEVIDAIKSADVKLPEGARDLRYAIAGFREHTVWIKFTVPKEQLWKTVQNNIFREKQHLQSEVPKPLSDDILFNRNQHLDLSWWNPKQVQHPLSWNHDENYPGRRYLDQWLVDEEKSTVYVMRGDG